MRIISGTAKGRKLASFSGQQIRPTSDRVREAIFSMLLSRLGSFEGRAVLDLYAGTGAMAIEALSRGAARAVLVDPESQATQLIRSNLQTCGFDQKGHHLRSTVEAALPRLSAESFDLIFADPPYGQGLAAATLQFLSEQELLMPGGLLCIETARGEELPATAGPLERHDWRRYGATAVHLYLRHQSEASR
ncbi:MAG: 16S rRNA (guanine(966)-N(2))-methyltransferase RsmD [Desulfuromonadales bacterium]|nr:16S rRNA (guanine(966)-N(2))-methyltransferase RsmD [Desulfuromonadales bacterium]